MAMEVQPRARSSGSDPGCAGGNLCIADDQNSRIRILTRVVDPVDPESPAAITIGVSATAFGGLTSIAPSSWIEIFGSNLAAGPADFDGASAPLSLDGTRVTTDGQEAFIAYISPYQVNAQVPSNVGLGSQEITVGTAAPAQAGLIR